MKSNKRKKGKKRPPFVPYCTDYEKLLYLYDDDDERVAIVTPTNAVIYVTLRGDEHDRYN